MNTLYIHLSGRGKQLLFLHGIGASHRMWDEIIKLLPQTYLFITFDLLGFGRSQKPDIEYTTGQHITAIEQTLNEQNSKHPVTIIGHSLGSLLAIEYAHRFPKQVEKLVLISPPIYKTPQEAKKTIMYSSPRVEYLLYSPFGRFYCGIHCTFHAFFSFVLPLFIRTYPKAVIQDFLLHTWKSYKRTVTNVIENQHAYEILQTLPIPTLMLYGNNDNLINQQTFEELVAKNKHITIKKLSAKHDFPLIHPEIVAKEIELFLHAS